MTSKVSELTFEPYLKPYTNDYSDVSLFKNFKTIAKTPYKRSEDTVKNFDVITSIKENKEDYGIEKRY
jgi:hypothetical protein